MQVQLNEQLYREAQRRAAGEGFASVDEYVADVVSHDLTGEVEETDEPNIDHLFTPERLAIIDEAAAQIKAGNFYTAEQAEAIREKLDRDRERKDARDALKSKLLEGLDSGTPIPFTEGHFKKKRKRKPR